MQTPLVERAGRDTVERRVLELVEEFVAELGGFRGPIAAHNVLDRDLGIASLERVELLLRLEQAFGVRLSDAVMAEAESPRDLADAIRTASPTTAEGVPETRAPVGPGTSAPAHLETLLELPLTGALAAVGLPSYARIKRFAVLPVNFTEAGGELTPTQKVKRKVVAEQYSDVIESLYRW